MFAPTSDFVASSHQGKVIITRRKGKFKIEMSPGETDKATYVVGLALSMIELPDVPDHIKNTPFVLRFFPKQVLALERIDSMGSMPFRVNEGDDLIKTIQMGQGICLNEQTHGRAIPSNPAPPSNMVSDEPL